MSFYFGQRRLGFDRDHDVETRFCNVAHAVTTEYQMRKSGSGGGGDRFVMSAACPSVLVFDQTRASDRGSRMLGSR